MSACSRATRRVLEKFENGRMVEAENVTKPHAEGPTKQESAPNPSVTQLDGVQLTAKGLEERVECL